MPISLPESIRASGGIANTTDSSISGRMEYYMG